MTSATRLFAWLLAFSCGAVVAMVLLVSRQDVDAAAAARTIHTCAANDGTLRLADPAQPCLPDERRVRVHIPGQDDPECTDDNARIEKLERRLKDLEARDRRGTLRGRRVHAPFDVVTKKGAKVLHIEEEEVSLYNTAQQVAVWIIADENGGVLHAIANGRARGASIIAQGNLARMVIREKDQDRIDLGRRSVGNYALQVYAGDKLAAVLGQSRLGSGLAQVFDVAGTLKASMFVEDGVAGHIEVANAAGKIVGVMQAAGKGGASPFQLSDGSGTAMVEAGMSSGAGVVRAGPAFRPFGFGFVGLTPSMIIGKP